MPYRSCVVSFTDPEGIEHSVRVSAASLFEAAVLAMAEFRRHGFADTTFGPATKLSVRVMAPEAAHVVSVGKVKTWLDGGGKSPSEEPIEVSAHAVNAVASGECGSLQPKADEELYLILGRQETQRSPTCVADLRGDLQRSHGDDPHTTAKHHACAPQ